MTQQDFRHLVLALEGAVEGAHQGHPDFRANGRIFATLHAGGETGMVKLTPDQQEVLLRHSPDAFEPEAGAWGRNGCTRVHLTRVEKKLLAEALRLAWENASSRPAARPRKPKRIAARSRAR